jgi:hypothetical protein
MSDNTRRTGKRELRFGVVAAGKGFITPDQLFKALKVQVREDLEEETHRLLGEILLELGAMTPEQKDEVLEVLEGLEHVFG